MSGLQVEPAPALNCSCVTAVIQNGAPAPCDQFIYRQNPAAPNRKFPNTCWDWESKWKTADKKLKRRQVLDVFDTAHTPFSQG